MAFSASAKLKATAPIYWLVSLARTQWNVFVAPDERFFTLHDFKAEGSKIDLEFNEYQMAHGINPECFHDMASWLKSKGVL